MLDVREWQTRKAKRKKAACSPERNDQIKIVSWLRDNGIVHFSVPNGFKRTPMQGAIEKAMGLSAGVPDLIIPIARKGYHAMALEVKREAGGRLSEKQMYWLEVLNKEGWYAIEGKGFDQCVKLIRDYLY